jgi:hypothetical protein
MIYMPHAEEALAVIHTLHYCFHVHRSSLFSLKTRHYFASPSTIVLSRQPAFNVRHLKPSDNNIHNKFREIAMKKSNIKAREMQRKKAIN